MNVSFAVSILAGVTLVTAGSLLVVRLARKSRAATRHVSLASTFITLLLLPAVSPIAPRRELAVPAVPRSSVVAPAVEMLADVVSTAPRSTGAPQATEEPRAFQMPSWSTLLIAGWLAGSGL